jgi:hypothetical protein
MQIFICSKEKTWIVMSVQTFKAQDKATLDSESTRGFNMAAFKLTAIQVTRLLM